MLFVAKIYNYSHDIQSDVTGPVMTGNQGYQILTTVPYITARFKNWQDRALEPYAQQLALEFFDNLDRNSQGEPPGAYRHHGMASDPDFQLVQYEASDYAYHFSSFDTEKDCPRVAGMTDTEVRELVEHTLLQSSDLGTSFIRVDREQLSAPWAQYDEQRKQPGAHNAIPALVKKTGFDVHKVIAYESAQDDPGEGLLRSLQALAEEQAEARRELEALSVEL